ncbi:hypothetical protein GCM10023065_01710 [Microbacterium laevaniformans]|nr:hypothetical protein GCM10017578_28160 [Microbacterium laevaniformans]
MSTDWVRACSSRVVALAEEVSPVVSCAPRDIARLERLKAAPEDLIDIQRCVALVAGMGLDALWPETQQGLAVLPREVVNG